MADSYRVGDAVIVRLAYPLGRGTGLVKSRKASIDDRSGPPRYRVELDGGGWTLASADMLSRAPKQEALF